MSDPEARVRLALADVYEPEGVEIWMRSRNPMLDHRTPNDLIAAGEAERVLNLIAALADGVVF